MKFVMFIAMFGLAVVGCGGDDDEGNDVSSVAEESATRDEPVATCTVPSGTFAFTSSVTSVLGGCSVEDESLSATVVLAGSLQDFVTSSCKGTATWAPGGSCTVRVQETCSDQAVTTELRVSADGRTLQGTRTQRVGSCEVRASLSGTRSSTSTSTTPTTPTSPTTPTTPTSPTTSSRLNVQLLYEDGVDAGIGVYLEYVRYRLYANGTFESCAHELSVGPGVQSNEPFEKSRGSYEIVGSTLQLRPASGANVSLSFSYSASSGQATIDGELYEEETFSTSSAELCEF